MSEISQKKAIKELLAAGVTTRAELMAAKRVIAKKYGIEILENSAILKTLPKLGLGTALNKLLRKRSVRTLSGIAPVAVLTKPFACPGECAYCPTEKDVPQSYLSNEPAVMRAIRCEYDPFRQVQLRLKALEANGHAPTKIELIVIGGTWSVLPIEYKFWYIANCFLAANNYRARDAKRNDQIKAPLSQKLSLKKLKAILLLEQKKNEKAKYKLIGVTLETRPDYIDAAELLEMRELGCTRVELGVQAIDERILKLNKRGHGVQAIVEATKLLREFGFKVTYHLMPGLPGATAGKDLKMFKQLFIDERFQPDQLKFYPTVVTKGSLLYRWWQQGKYKPYSDKVLQKLIIDCKKLVPQYVRIIRLIRDIPGESIVAGNKITNLRQVLEQQGVECNCIRCREAKENQLQINNYKLRISKYMAADGSEYFIEACSKDGKILYGFCRLRLPRVTPLKLASSGGQKKSLLIKEIGGSDSSFSLQDVAMIRELHVYGELVSVGVETRHASSVQHEGLGKRLMAEAEKIAKKNKFKRMAVIAGVGVRGYYRKLGYRLKATYMLKDL